jgi:hypothetical protein
VATNDANGGFNEGAHNAIKGFQKTVVATEAAKGALNEFKNNVRIHRDRFGDGFIENDGGGVDEKDGDRNIGIHGDGFVEKSGDGLVENYSMATVGANGVKKDFKKSIMATDDTNDRLNESKETNDAAIRASDSAMRVDDDTMGAAGPGDDIYGDEVFGTNATWRS